MQKNEATKEPGSLLIEPPIISVAIQEKLFEMVREFAEIDLEHKFVSVFSEHDLSYSERRLLRLMRRLGYFVQLRFVE